MVVTATTGAFLQKKKKIFSQRCEGICRHLFLLSIQTVFRAAIRRLKLREQQDEKNYAAIFGRDSSVFF